jgi:hypothetical protein
MHPIRAANFVDLALGDNCQGAIATACFNQQHRRNGSSACPDRSTISAGRMPTPSIARGPLARCGDVHHIGALARVAAKAPTKQLGHIVPSTTRILPLKPIFPVLRPAL